MENKMIIRYAGYDPDENKFVMTTAEERASENFAMARASRKGIDPDRAMQLKREGKKMREIGDIIAFEQGRRMPYTTETVRKAIRKYRCNE